MKTSFWSIGFSCSTVAVSIHSVAMTRRLAGDENTSRVGAAVEDLMRLARRYFEALTSLKDEALLLYFEGQLSFKDVEELP